MKKKLKKRLKLIKAIFFGFGFFMLFAFMFGISEAGKTKSRAKQEENLERVSTIIPLSFGIDDKDYIIIQESEANIVSSENAVLKSRQINTENVQKRQERVAIPKVFGSEGDTLYGRSDETPAVSYSNFSSPIDRALKTLSNSSKKLDNNDKNIIHIEQGRNSGIFVGKNNAGGAKGGNNLLESVTSQLGGALGGLQNANATSDSYTSQNNQKGKQKFLDSFSGGQSYDLSSEGEYLNEKGEYYIIAGSVIPMVMVTGIDSDLPGMISGRVTEDVYDSLYAKYIIIPKGSMVIGTYDSSLSWGQKRVLVAWSRLSRPDGFTLEIEGMQGTDAQGQSGISGNVKTYIGGSIATALLTSAFSLGINYTTYSARNADETGSLEGAVDSAGSSVGNTLKSLAEKLLNRQPTIKIKPGTRANIFVNKDIRMPIFTRGRGE